MAAFAGRAMAPSLWHDAGYNNQISKPLFLFITIIAIVISIHVAGFVFFRKAQSRAVLACTVILSLAIVVCVHSWGLPGGITKAYLHGWSQRVRESRLDFDQIRSNLPKSSTYEMTEAEQQLLKTRFKAIEHYRDHGPSVVVRRLDPFVVDFCYGGGFGVLTGIRIFANPLQSHLLNVFNESINELEPGVFIYVKL